jgi:hypothetical protein
MEKLIYRFMFAEGNDDKNANQVKLAQTPKRGVQDPEFIQLMHRVGVLLAATVGSFQRPG